MAGKTAEVGMTRRRRLSCPMRRSQSVHRPPKERSEEVVTSGYANAALLSMVAAVSGTKRNNATKLGNLCNSDFSSVLHRPSILTREFHVY